LFNYTTYLRNVLQLKKCEISGSHSGVAEDSGVLQNVRILSPNDSPRKPKSSTLFL